MRDQRQRDVCTALGTAIRTRRTELGLTQERFAFAAGLNRSYVTELEAGKRNPSLRNVERIAKALRLTLADLAKLIESDVADGPSRRRN